MHPANKPLIALGIGALLVAAGCGHSNRTANNQSSPSSETAQNDRTGMASREANPNDTANRTANLSAADREFMMKAAQGGMAEVQMGQLAKDNSSNDGVKSFGDKLINDHKAANDDLKDIASRANVTLPTDLDAKHKASIDRLSKLKGSAFDRAFLKDQVKDHEHDIAEFRKEANNGQDTDVKNFASQKLPTLEDHLKMARDLQSGKRTNTAKGVSE